MSVERSQQGSAPGRRPASSRRRAAFSPRWSPARAGASRRRASAAVWASRRTGRARPPARRARAPLPTPEAPHPQLAVIAEVKRRSPSKGDIAPGARRRHAGTRLRRRGSGRRLGAHRAVALRRLARRPARRGRGRRPPGAAQGLHRRQGADLGGGRGRGRRRPPHRRDPRATTACTTCSSRPWTAASTRWSRSTTSRRRGGPAAPAAPWSGINNRDLVTLDVDLATTEYLAPALGPCMFPVSESGIANAADACRAALAGARALLVGEALVRTPPGELAMAIGRLKDPGWTL